MLRTIALPLSLSWPLGLLLAAQGCGAGDAGESPIATVEAFVDAMGRSATDASGLSDAYRLLDKSARAELRERAQRAASLSGREYEPHQMLAQGRFRLRFAPAPAGGMKARVDGDSAVVTVKAAAADQRAEIPLVREGGQWRIKLEIPPMQKASPRSDMTP